MLTILSPSKTLDFSGKTAGKYTHHEFPEESLQLIEILRKLKIKDIAELMGLSEKLSQLNYQRYKDFSLPFTMQNSKQAIYAFKGDVYEGLAIENFSSADIAYAQDHLRIISGLYGLLRPLDLIQPYRLEMGTSLVTKQGKDLYKFWGKKIAESLNSLDSKILINLASEEYFKALDKKILKSEIVTPVFMEKRGGDYKIISFFAKKARGAMAAYIVKNRIETLAGLKDFNEERYKFNKTLSKDLKLVFAR